VISRTFSIRTLLPWLVTALVAAEAGAQLRAVPITVPDTVYEFDGYSVVSPPGKDWFELQRDRNNALFGKKIASRTHAFIATAQSTPIAEKFQSPEQFLEYVSKAALEPDDKRNRLIENRVELDPAVGRYCVRFYTKALDRGALSARGFPLVLETYGVSCVHPGDPGLVVNVSYSERGQLAEDSPELLAEGARFVESLKFTDIKR
jgi:hypothetical protein